MQQAASPQVPIDGAFSERVEPMVLNECGRDQNQPVCPKCKGRFDDGWKSLREINPGEKDKMGKVVARVLWVGENYKVYLTSDGVYVYFSDCRNEERVQRRLYDLVCVRLCQLRFLTSQLTDSLSWRASRGSGFYDHEIAQAIVQALQQRCDAARQILDLGLVMAADRLKDENRVRYLSACFGVALMICAIGGLLCWMSPQVGAVGNAAQPYLLASVFGAIGAAFSIGVRVRSFEFAPCRYSPMNYVMGGLRVTMGVIAGGVLLLLVTAKLIPVFVDGLNDLVGSLSGQPSAWTKVAAIGFLAGFAERLVPNLMRGADQQMSHYQQVASVNAEQVAREEDKAMKPAS